MDKDGICISKVMDDEILKNNFYQIAEKYPSKFSGTKSSRPDACGYIEGIR